MAEQSRLREICSKCRLGEEIAGDGSISLDNIHDGTVGRVAKVAPEHATSCTFDPDEIDEQRHGLDEETRTNDALATLLSCVAYAASAEEVRRYTKAAKHDLRDRELRRASYPGDHGHVKIGGHAYTLYRTTPPLLLRDEFAAWCENNWAKYLTKDGRERQSTKPLHTEDVQCLPVGRFAFEVKNRAKDLNEPTELLHESAWNTQFDMERALHRYHAEIERDRKAGQNYIITKLQAVLLAAMAQHRRRNYAEAVDNFITAAACAVKAAEFEARMHAKEAAQ